MKVECGYHNSILQCKPVCIATVALWHLLQGLCHQLELGHGIFPGALAMEGAQQPASPNTHAKHAAQQPQRPTLEEEDCYSREQVHPVLRITRTHATINARHRRNFDKEY